MAENGRPAAAPAVTIVAHDVGGVGGMERQLGELIAGLLAAGDRVALISRSCKLPPHPNLSWTQVPGPARPFAIGYPWFFLYVSFLLWARRPPLVHSTGAIVLNRTALCTVHLCHRATAELGGFSRVSKPGAAHRLNARVAAAMSRLAERWCYSPRRTRLLVGVSSGVAAELRRHFPRMGGRVAVVPNGVDTDAFRPPPPAAANGERLEALFVGGEWRGKGLGLAIEALAECPAATLTVVGSGDVGAFRQVAERAGVGDRVSFAGVATDPAEWYRRADVFLLPSTYETFSLVTYEAAASGLPLLATRVSGVEDLLEDGRNGWFVERDPAAIAARLRQLRADPELRRRMGAAAREASLGYSWARTVDHYRALYRELAPPEAPR